MFYYMDNLETNQHKHLILFDTTKAHYKTWDEITYHYSDVILGTMASHITSLMIVNTTIYPGADQRKHQSSASLALVWGIHRWPVKSPNKGPVTRKMFPFDEVSCLYIKQCKRPHMPIDNRNISTPTNQHSYLAIRCSSITLQNWLINDKCFINNTKCSRDGF